MSSLSWILKAEECWGEVKIPTKGVVDWREEGGGRGRGKENTPAAVIVLLGNSVRGRTEFLIGAV